MRCFDGVKLEVGGSSSIVCKWLAYLSLSALVPSLLDNMSVMFLRVQQAINVTKFSCEDSSRHPHACLTPRDRKPCRWDILPYIRCGSFWRRGAGGFYAPVQVLPTPAVSNFLIELKILRSVLLVDVRSNGRVNSGCSLCQDLNS